MIIPAIFDAVSQRTLRLCSDALITSVYSRSISRKDIANVSGLWLALVSLVIEGSTHRNTMLNLSDSSTMTPTTETESQFIWL